MECVMNVFFYLVWKWIAWECLEHLFFYICGGNSPLYSLFLYDFLFCFSVYSSKKGKERGCVCILSLCCSWELYFSTLCLSLSNKLEVRDVLLPMNKSGGRAVNDDLYLLILVTCGNREKGFGFLCVFLGQQRHTKAINHFDFPNFSMQICVY